MNGVMNENQLTVVKEYEYIKPLNGRIDCIFDNSYRDCYNKYFQTFEYKCVYDIQFKNICNNEIVHLTIADKNTNLYDLRKIL